MDGKNFPAYMKSKVREIFKDRASYRSLYRPLGNISVDTTWTFQWPKFGIDLLNFFEMILFGSTPTEDQNLRAAFKAAKSPEETLALYPWSDVVQDLLTELQCAAAPETTDFPARSADIICIDETTGLATSRTNVEAESATGDSDNEQDEDGMAKLKALNGAVERCMTDRVFCCVEPSTQSQLGALIKASPLGVVEASPQSGNVLVLFDCNTYGLSDSKPSLRQCPIAEKGWNKSLRAVLEARCGSEAPVHLKEGDFWLMIDGGKDRKRHFFRNLKGAAGKKDAKRTVFQKITLHCTEKSVRKRRGRARGLVKVTQTIHIARNKATCKKDREYENYEGSTSSDIFGPVELDPPQIMPTLLKDDRHTFFGRHVCRAGGKDDESSSNDQSDEELSEIGALIDEFDHEPTDVNEHQCIIHPHALPVKVVDNIVAALGVKHVIDLTPTSLPLGVALLERGCSYFALCCTSFQRDHLEKTMRAGIKKALLDTNSSLYDRRFVDASTEPASKPAKEGIAKPKSKAASAKKKKEVDFVDGEDDEDDDDDDDTNEISKLQPPQKKKKLTPASNEGEDQTLAALLDAARKSSSKGGTPASEN